MDIALAKAVLGLPWWLMPPRIHMPVQDMFDNWVGKIPWRRKWQPTPVFCLGIPLDRGAQWAIVHGVTKESDTTY